MCDFIETCLLSSVYKLYRQKKTHQKHKNLLATKLHSYRNGRRKIKKKIFFEFSQRKEKEKPFLLSRRHFQWCTALWFRTGMNRDVSSELFNHLFAHSLAYSHTRTLICLLHTAHFASMLHCAHSFTHSLNHSVPSLRESE